jgi:malate synthase
MSVQSRVNFPTVDGDELLTEDFLKFLLEAHDKFSSRVSSIRKNRKKMIENAIKNGILPTLPFDSDINQGDWKVSPVPAQLLEPGIEISGPVSITNMAINALNPGPEGERAEGYLDDDEDSGGHRLIDTLSAARNRLGATKGTLSFYNPIRDRKYELADGQLPFFMHRERGLHLDESDLQIDGNPISATILGMGLTMYYCGLAQVERGQGLYFYLPKMELVDEAEWYKDFFDFSKSFLNYPVGAVVKAIPLVESLPIVFVMDEVLYALGEYAAGLNAARWDLKASVLEYTMSDLNSVWPDRFGVDIKTTEFISNIFKRLVAVCLRRGAVPIGGMATALPSRDEIVNETASKSISEDKEWEARQGFVRAWVAHIFHMKAAADPFKNLRNSGWEPTPEMSDPNNFPILISAPEGPITEEGTRRNARMLVEYVEGWLSGRGAKGIDSLEGKPGIHPALMEDLATGRISVAQMAQRIIHKVKTEDTSMVHTFGMVKKILLEETDDILRIKGEDFKNLESEEYLKISDDYHRALKVAMLWTKNYTDYNFRSLGSYTHSDFEKISNEPDVF